ncbi:MAG: Maf family protein [Gammaproteobacteria bacterium]
MDTPRLLLASASPRRRALLAGLGIEFDVHPVDVDESRRPGEAPGALAARLAREKARAAAEAAGPRPLLAADTVVALDDEVFGKPVDESDAARMLRMLSGRVHQVYTAVAVARDVARDDVLSETRVRFRRLTDGEIRAYIATGEPMDKAGAYGIQGLGGIFIEHLAGSYTGVVGLPVFETARLLAGAGLPVLAAEDS